MITMYFGGLLGQQVNGRQKMSRIFGSVMNFDTDKNESCPRHILAPNMIQNVHCEAIFWS